MTKKRVLALLLTLVMLLGMLPMSVVADNGIDTYANSSVPLTLNVSSYSAPFINGNTGEHTVNSITKTEYIRRSAVGSDNASGSATARFEGSNETGWTLVIDVVIGDYFDTWTTNARITNKDMSAATGSVTFGLSFNTAGGTSTYIHISGGKNLPHTDHTWKYVDNGDGTHTGHCTYPGCNATTDESEKHIPGNDGFCTKCGACTHEKDKDGYCTVDDCQHIKDNKGCCKKPETPDPIIPSQPGKGDFDATKLVTVHCTTNAKHPDETYDLIEGSYVIGTMTGETGDYTCPVTVTADKYVEAYVGTYGKHTLSGDSEKTFNLIWNAEGEKWKPEGGVTFNVACEKEPEPEIPDAPTWMDLSGSVKVVCINPTTGKDDCCDWDVSVKSALATEGKYTMTRVDDFTYAVTLSASFYAGQYSGNRGSGAEKVAHDLYSKETLNWTAAYADGKWTMTPDAEGEDDVVLVTHAPEKWKEVGKMGKDVEGKSTGIKATCTTGSYGPITYGLTTAFVYADTDVISVEYQGEGRYLATFRTDKYVESIGKGCSDHFEDTRSHKLTSGNETVQWYLSVGEKDKTTGKYSWYSEPVTEADGAITVAHAWRITFHPENGEDDFVVEAYDGETAVKPTDPAKSGYTFAGWYTAEQEQYTFTETVTGDLDLYGTWTLIPPAEGRKPSYSGLKVKVDCVDNKSGHTQGAYYYGLVIGLNDTTGFNEPENGWVEENGAYYYTITINKDVYVAKYANTTKTAHTENGENANEVKWQWNGTEWVLVNEKDNQGGVLTINVKCEEKQTVNVVIYRNGDFSKAYKTVALDPQPKGTVIDLTKLDIADYYTANYTGKYEFHGWFNDGAWNEYKNNPAREGEASITVNGWTNIICMVYDYENVVYFKTAEDLNAYQADHSKTEGLLFSTTALHGAALPTADAPAAKRGGYTFKFWSREGQTTDVAGQTVGGWTNLYANWEITPHTIYAYARLNSAFAPLTPDDLKDTITLKAETLKNLGLGSYNANGFISIGTFSFDEMPLTDALYGAAYDSEEFDAAVAALEENIVLETGVDEDTARLIVWTALYKAGGDSGMDAGYPTADENGYQMTGNLNLAAVMFQPGGDNVGGMPAVNYTCDDIFEIYDFYLPGQSIEMPADPTRENYTFKGWSVKVIPGETDVYAGTGDADLLQAGDTYEITEGGVIFTAEWEPNTYDYTVRHIKQLPDGTYDEKNAELERLSGKFGTLAVVNAKDYGEHYPVNDAAQKQNIQIVKGLVIDVHYDLDSHTLTFDPNGGSDVTPDTVTVRHGAQVVDGPLLPPTRTGFTFTGWYDDTDGKNPHDFTQGLTEDKTVYAGWVKASPAVITYRLTIDYVYTDGSQAAESKVLDLVPCEDYLVNSPRISGYRADKTVVEGAMPEHDVTETVVYRRVYTPGGSTVIPTPSKTELKFNAADHFAYVNGYPDGTVKPNGNITRAEVAAILYRIMDADCVKTYYDTASSYRDVARGDWFNVYIATLENAGVIVDTRAGGYFRPNEAITRAELAAMLAQFSQTKSAANYFNDVPANYWAANAIAVCAKLGWINGYPDGSFRPDQTVTRAEMMAMINRALERTPKSAADLLAGMKVWSDNANVNAWYYIDVQEATNGHTYTKSGTHETWTKLTN